MNASSKAGKLSLSFPARFEKGFFRTRRSDGKSGGASDMVLFKKSSNQ